MAILEAVPGKEEELEAVLQEFYTMMHSKGYSRDSLHRDGSHPGRLLHLRFWKSEEARGEAQNDPDVHRYWQRLPELCTIPSVYDQLEKVFET